MDGIVRWMGVRWDDHRTVRVTIRPELLNAGGRLAGAVGFSLVDYSMGSALWEETTEEEMIATISISITYLESATEGDVVCTTQLDRRTRTNAALRSEVRHEDGRLLCTPVGSYAIFTRKGPPEDRAALSPES